MRSSKTHILIIAVSVVVFLYVFWTRYNNYTEAGYAPSYPNGVVSNSAEISADEINAFIKTKHRYKEEKIDKLGFTDLSMVTDISLSEANPKLAKWLRRKAWDSERFFYIEGRIRMIVVTILKDEEIARNRQLMLEQASGIKDRGLSAVLLRNATELDKKLNIEHITAAEYEIVRPKIKEIMALLEIDGAN